MINCNIGIAPGSTLTIQPGTQVRFNGNYSLNVGGTLIAEGSESQPIQFTGTGWGRIFFDDPGADAVADENGVYQSGSILRWVQVKGAAEGITCSGATPYISHLTAIGGGVGCSDGGATPLWLIDSSIQGTVTLPGGARSTGNTTSGGLSCGSSCLVEKTTAKSIGVSSDGLVRSNHVKGGSISASTPTEISGNKIEGSEGWGIYVGGDGAAAITGNRLVGNANGIKADAGTIQGNLIANSGGTGVEIGSVTLRNNSIIGSGGSTVKIVSGVPGSIDHNNFEFNKGTYDVENLLPGTTLANIPAQNNWWGTTDNNRIKARIFDFYDGDYTLGKIVYDPKLPGPDQTAPAYVRSVTLNPASPVGIETVTFTAAFSRPMDTSDDPYMIFLNPKADTWRTKASMPTRRSGLGVAAQNGKIYAIGGRNDYNLRLGTVEEYDPATDTWRTRASMPTPRMGLGVAAAQNGKIYAIGGLTIITSTNYVSAVEEYEPSTDTWMTRASMPTPRSGLGVVAAQNGKIYAIGGKDSNSYMGFVEEYDPIANTWTTKANMPTPRSDLGVVVAENGKIYAIGGEGGENVVEEYDPVMDTWMRRASMPTPRSGFGVAAAQNGKIYAIGGWLSPDEYHPYNIVEEYDPATDTWKTMAGMSGGRFWLAVVAAKNNKTYAIGGCGGMCSSSDMVEEYTLPDDGLGEINVTPQWIDATHFRASYEFTSQTKRGDYVAVVSNASGTDGMEIIPYTSPIFKVDYAGSISDETAPLAPSVSSCGSSTPGALSAAWISTDPQSKIDKYRYAIGTQPGGTEITSWATLTGTTMTRSGLGLTNGKTYYVSVQARNEGGLWSDYGSSAVVAGTAGCGLSGRITDSKGSPVAGVTVSAGGGRTAITDAQGFYRFVALAPGTYTLTPLHGKFEPASRSITLPNSGVSADFVGTLIYKVYLPVLSK